MPTWWSASESSRWSRGRRCWDGALGGYNNPVLAGITEALANGIEPQAIEVLSIGTGSVILPTASGNEDAATAKLVQQRARTSFTGDLKKLAGSILDDPPDAASLIAHLMLGQAVPGDGAHPTAEGRLVRMNPLLQPIRVAGSWARPAGIWPDWCQRARYDVAARVSAAVKSVWPSL